jgi:protocatechuate 3,4-dioxygenase beta subunit
MHTLKTTTIVSAAFLSLLLTACGGGSSSPLDPPRSSSANVSSSAAQLSSGAASSVDTVSPQKLGAGTGANFREGVIEVTNDLTNLSAGGATTLSVYVVTSTDTPAATAIQVSFISDCVSSGKAILKNSANEEVTTISTINGRASINYNANGCSDTDTIIASANIDGVVKNAQIELNIDRGTAGSIQFVDSAPKQISLKGSGGGTETSLVRFRVTDENGAPLDKTQVNFTIASTPGGLSFTPASATSNSEGYVTTRVTSGNVATPVSISATVVDTNISTSSSELVVSSGIPVQRSVSLSASKFNPRAWDKDGEEVTLTMSMADDFGNPVIDGTAVTFWAEGGRVNPSCFTFNGTCTVSWYSQEFRPRDGRVTVLAFASGNETFTDTNSNGRYDLGEPVENLGEAYLDENESNTYTLGERFVDVDLPGHTALTRDGPTVSPVYNGTLCYSDNASVCTNDKVTVRDSVILSMSSPNGNLSLWSDSNCNSSPFSGTIAGARGTIYLLAADRNQNSLPNGTKLTINGSPVAMTTTLDTVIPNNPNAACIPMSVAANPSAPISATFSIKAEVSGDESFSENFGINFL